MITLVDPPPFVKRNRFDGFQRVKIAGLAGLVSGKSMKTATILGGVSQAISIDLAGTFVHQPRKITDPVFWERHPNQVFFSGFGFGPGRALLPIF